MSDSTSRRNMIATLFGIPIAATVERSPLVTERTPDAKAFSKALEDVRLAMDRNIEYDTEDVVLERIQGNLIPGHGYDTEALRRVCATRKMIYVNRGRYLISSPIAIKNIARYVL